MKTYQTAKGGSEKGQDSRRDRSGCSEDESQVSTQTGLQRKQREMNEKMDFILSHTSPHKYNTLYIHKGALQHLFNNCSFGVNIKDTCLYLIEDQSVPQAVVPHDSTAQLGLFPPDGVMKNDSPQRRRNRAQNLHAHMTFITSERFNTRYSPFVSNTDIQHSLYHRCG